MSEENQRNWAILKKLREKPENKVCIDCTTKNPDWCSLQFGVFFCLTCSGVHRSLGVDVSFVKSASYDKWSDEQVQTIVLGGNKKAREYFVNKGIDKMGIAQKYNSKAAKEYATLLKQQAQKAGGTTEKKPTLSVNTNITTDNEEKVKSAPPLSSSSANNEWSFEDEMLKETSTPSPTVSEPKYKVLTSSSSNNSIKIKPGRTISNSSSSKDIFSQDSFSKAKTSSKKNSNANLDDDIFGTREVAVEKQVVNDDDFFDNDWDKEDDHVSTPTMKKSSSTTSNSSNKINNNTDRYSGIGSGYSNNNNSQSYGNNNNSYGEAYSSTMNTDRYKGIGSAGSSNSRKNPFTNGDISNMSGSDIAWYLGEQAKDVASKTKEVSHYLGDQFTVVSHNVSTWFNSMMQQNEHK